jgi:hypothetical protein
MNPLDPATLEYCDLCRSETRHTPCPYSGKRFCEWHRTPHELVVHVDRFEDAPQAVADAHRLRRASAGH